jgi:hypothetical protein
MPFVALKLPLISIKLMNAVLLYLSIVFLFKALIQFTSFRKALLISLFWAFYYNLYYYLPFMYAEPFVVFLISFLLYVLLKAFKQNDFSLSKKHVLLSGFIIGIIVLTKVIFGYVILLMLAFSLLAWLFNRKSVNYKKAVIILLVALATVSPYLAYTYSLTGRAFYWATSGGNNMYWMSSYHEMEYGSWFPDPVLEADSASMKNSEHDNFVNTGVLNLKSGPSFTPGFEDSIKLHHQKDFEEINKYTGIERDDAYMRMAIRNIKAHPKKYIQNCISNIGRILFNTPNSYTNQQPGNLSRIPFNGVIVLLSLFCMVVTLLNWRRVSFLMKFILFFTFIYLGGSIFGSAESRMFTIIVPLLLVWIAYITGFTVKIKLRLDGEQAGTGNSSGT